MCPFSETQPSLPSFDRAICKTSLSPINDILIALSGRSIGARVVAGNGQDFRLIQQFRDFALEIIDSESSAR